MPLSKEDALNFTEITERPAGEKASVRCDPEAYRIKCARKQAKLSPTPVETVARYTNEFLESLGMRVEDSPKFEFEEGKTDEEINEIANREIYEPNRERFGNSKDLVWMKFTEDGYLGVVAVSDDINFDIPPKETTEIKNYTTSGIIVRALGKQWDRRFVLAFPLTNFPGKIARRDIETGIGNYLISKGVPILDYYSHRY